MRPLNSDYRYSNVLPLKQCHFSCYESWNDGCDPSYQKNSFNVCLSNGINRVNLWLEGIPLISWYFYFNWLSSSLFWNRMFFFLILSSRVGRKRDYSPLPWNDFFDDSQDVVVGTNVSFRGRCIMLPCVVITILIQAYTVLQENIDALK